MRFESNLKSPEKAEGLVEAEQLGSELALHHKKLAELLQTANEKLADGIITPAQYDQVVERIIRSANPGNEIKRILSGIANIVDGVGNVSGSVAGVVEKIFNPALNLSTTIIEKPGSAAVHLAADAAKLTIEILEEAAVAVAETGVQIAIVLSEGLLKGYRTIADAYHE